MQDKVTIKDKIMKSGKWEFDEEVAVVFDEMLGRSIPDYENMRNLVYNIGKHFIKPNTIVMDVGCSNGIAVRPFVQSFKNDFMLLDISEPMLEVCKRNYEDNNNVTIKHYDLRDGVPNLNCSLILSILTLQFTPIEYRHKIVRSIYESLNDGGCFIFVEKVLGNTSDIDNLLVDEYYQMKKEHQYTNEQIQNKRKSLEGVLVPVTENWNIELLKQAGFTKIDCFWRYLNFCGFIAIK
jgi:tRNA (cmo5U34)-methyltransferase